MNRRQSFFIMIFVILWAVLSLWLDRHQEPLTDAEIMRESIKWGIP